MIFNTDIDELEVNGSAGWMPVVTSDIRQFGAVANGVADNRTAIQSAINSLPTSGGIVYVPAGTWACSVGLDVPSNVTIQGAGIDTTVFKVIGAPGEALFTTFGTESPKNNIVFKDFTIDVNGVDSGIQCEYVSNFTVQRVRTKNVPFWGVWVGVRDGSDAAIRNTHILVEDCVFDGEQQTYEGVLIFNSTDVVIRHNTFSGNATAPGLGLYQNVDNAQVVENVFSGLAYGAYFGVSTQNISFVRNRFEGNNNGLQGANASDNSNFGFTKALNIRIVGNDFISCVTATNLGSIQGLILANNLYYLNSQNSVVFTKGFFDSGLTTPVTNASITNNSFLNNNQAGNLYQLHAPVLYENVGGPLNHTYVGNQFFDNQITPTQQDVITFDGAFTYSNILFVGGEINTYNGGSTVSLADGATISNVYMRDVIGVTSSNTPASVQIIMDTAHGGTNKATWATGSIPFLSGPTTFGEDNGKLFWDATNHRLGINTNAPAQRLSVNGEIYAGDLFTGAFAQVGSSGDPNNVWIDASHSVNTNTGIEFRTKGAGKFTFNTGTLTLAAYGSGTLATDSSGNVTTGATTLVNGGTGADLSGSGGSHQYVRQFSTGGPFSVGQPAFSDISGTVTTAQGGTNKTSWSAGSVPFLSSTTGFGEDNGNLNWDDTNVRLGIGTNAPGTTLGVNGNSAAIGNLFSGAFVYIGSLGDANNVWLDSRNTGSNSGMQFRTKGTGKFTFNTGTLTLAAYGAGTLTTDASGNVTASSDETLKDIRGYFERSIEVLRTIEPILFTWKEETGLDTEATYVGFSAQNVRSAIPEAVGVMADGSLTLMERPILAALVNAVKELDARICRMEVTIETLRNL